MTLNNFFERVFCITLEINNPQHPERLMETVKEFSRHGISVEFIQGVDGRLLDIDEPMSRDGDSVVRRADYGCTLSHLKVVSIAKERKLRNYCVFEDDVKLAADFQEQFARNIVQLPEKYRLIYLGGDNQEESPFPVICAPNIKTTKKTLTTHAVGVHESAYDDMITVLSKHEKVDLNISELHRQPGCYIMDPVIAGQRPGWSYILGKQVQNEHKFFQV